MWDTKLLKEKIQREKLTLEETGRREFKRKKKYTVI